MTDPVLELEALDIFAPGRRTGRQLVFGSSLTAGRGESVGIVGESGSGKTLTVRAIAGLLPDGFSMQRTIRIDGRDLDEA